MTKKAYDYLGCVIEVDSDESFQKLVRKNIEVLVEPEDIFGKLKVKTGNIGNIPFNKEFPYLKISENHEKDFYGVDHLRYGILAKSIWKKSPSEYEVHTRMKNDDWIISKIFKKIFYVHPRSEKKSLLHSSGLQIENRGILLSGMPWSGKTSLNVAFLDLIKDSRFLSEDEVFISRDKGGLRGYYVPGSVYARFSVFAGSRKLEAVLEHPEMLDALQVFDNDTISRVIAHRRYDLNLGLSLSRESFCRVLGVGSIPEMEIKKLIFTEYSSEKSPHTKKLSKEEAIELLKKRDMPKEIALDRVSKRENVFENESSLLEPLLLEGVELLKVSYDAKRHLTKGFVEDLAV